MSTSFLSLRSSVAARVSRDLLSIDCLQESAIIPDEDDDKDDDDDKPDLISSLLDGSEPGIS